MYSDVVVSHRMQITLSDSLIDYLRNHTPAVQLVSSLSDENELQAPYSL